MTLPHRQVALTVRPQTSASFYSTLEPLPPKARYRIGSSDPVSRWIGAVYRPYRADYHYHPADPREDYDVLAFVETTTAARPNRSANARCSPIANLRKRRSIWSSLAQAKYRRVGAHQERALRMHTGCVRRRTVAIWRTQCAHRAVICAVALG